jgi:lipopolysaccharide transport system permease protein
MHGGTNCDTRYRPAVSCNRWLPAIYDFAETNCGHGGSSPKWPVMAQVSQGQECNGTRTLSQSRFDRMLELLKQDLRSLLSQGALIRFMVSQRSRSSFFKTVLGQGWLIVAPLTEMAIYYFLIVIIFKVKPGGSVHPFVLLMTGLTHFLFLQQVLTAECSAILRHERILLQVRLEPLVFTAITFYEHTQKWVISLILLALVYFNMGPSVSSKILFYPCVLLLLCIIGWSGSVLFSALGIFLRDLPNILTIMLRITMYFSPVLYETSFVPDAYRGIYLYNPIACLFALLQWSTLEGSCPSFGPVLVLMAFTIGCFVLAHYLFNRMKPSFTKVL